MGRPLEEFFLGAHPRQPSLPGHMKAGSTPARTHLCALILAAVLVALGLGLGGIWSESQQDRFLKYAAPEFCDAKLHGVALIREAFSRPDTLVLFGSSELIPDVPMKGVDFFSDLPTGFSVFPVGKAGTTALSVLQKLGGAGETLTGKQVVLSLSPSFFQYEKVEPKYFEGNSSKLQTKELMWSSRYSEALKREAAAQILNYPKAYEGDWFLEVVLRRMASGGWVDRVVLALFEPLAQVDRWVGKMQDHLEATVALLEAKEAETVKPRKREVLGSIRRASWDQLFLSAEQSSRAFAKRSKKRPLKVQRRVGEGDAQFTQVLRKSQEWKDFELVLRLLKEAGAKPLILSMPVHADVLEAQGVSRKAWQEYGMRLRQMTGKYGTPLVYLEEYERDETFFVDHADHIGSKGWWFYNKAMDDFYHGRPLQSIPVASQKAPSF